MKTYKQFIVEVELSRELDENIIGGLSKLFKKKPPRNIDPYFANKAVERGSMERGVYGQSEKNIRQIKKTGMTPAVSGVYQDPKVQYKNDPATLDWINKTGYKGETDMARAGKDAYYATPDKEGRKTAGVYARRGANYENQRLQNVLNPLKRKDKGDTVDVVVNKRSVRKSWKPSTTQRRGRDIRTGAEQERIAAAKDIIPVVPGPSAKVAKYRLTQQLRKDRTDN